MSAPLEIGRRRVAPLIGEFHHAHPEVSVELVLSDLPADVIGNGLDLAFHTDDSRDGETVSRLLIPSRVRFFIEFVAGALKTPGAFSVA